MGETDALNSFLKELGFKYEKDIKPSDLTGDTPFTLSATSGATITDLNKIATLSNLSYLKSLTINNLNSLTGSNALTKSNVLPPSLTELDLQHNGLCVRNTVQKLVTDNDKLDVKVGNSLSGANIKGTDANPVLDNCYCGKEAPVHIDRLFMPSRCHTEPKCTDACEKPTPSNCVMSLSVLSVGTVPTLQIKTNGKCFTPSTESATVESSNEGCSSCDNNNGNGNTDNNNTYYNEHVPKENALLRNNIEDTIEPVNEISYDNKDSSDEICEHCLVTIGDEKHCNKFLDKEDCDYLGDSYSWKGN